MCVEILVLLALLKHQTLHCVSASTLLSNIPYPMCLNLRLCAGLIGIEYVISARLFEALPPEEHRFWHSHKHEVRANVVLQSERPTTEYRDWHLAGELHHGCVILQLSLYLEFGYGPSVRLKMAGLPYAKLRPVTASASPYIETLIWVDFYIGRYGWSR